MVDSQTSTIRPILDLLRNFLSQRKNRRVVVACSGGSDSVSLVLALKAVQPDLKLSLTVVHVDHQLRRTESDADRMFVQALARRLRLPLRLFRRPVLSGSGNLEEKARDARYEALFGLARRTRALVVTGHTRDDQAETLFMNLLRGCGPEGLSGMLPFRTDVGTGVEIGRPWLTVSRDQLRAFLARVNEPYREDSSNRDRKYLRNYVRLKVFKELEPRIPGFRQRLVRLAELARDEQPVWESLLREALKKAVRFHRGGQVMDGTKFDRMPVGIQRRLLRRVAGHDLLTFDGVERLRAWIQSPPSNGRILQFRKGWVVERLSKSGGSSSSSLYWFHGPLPEARSPKKRLIKRIKIHG